jgi:hypothetical protein
MTRALLLQAKAKPAVAIDLIIRVLPYVSSHKQSGATSEMAEPTGHSCGKGSEGPGKPSRITVNPANSTAIDLDQKSTR